MIQHAAVIDVGEWQTTVDLRDGRPLESDAPRVQIAREVIAAHPYPGDLSDEGLRWVTDTALDLHARYDPGYMMLDYAYAHLRAVYGTPSPEEQREAIAAVFGEVARFLDGTGYEPVVVGLGGTMPCLGRIETLDLDATVAAAGMHANFAGLFDATLSDLVKLGSRQGVAQIVSRDVFRAEFGGSEAFYAAFPDYLAVAEDGYLFRGVNSGTRLARRLPRPEETLPMATTLPVPAGDLSLVDVADIVLRGLEHTRVALILVEGVDVAGFPWPHREISNRVGWYRYTSGSHQYLALNTGQHFFEHPDAPGYRFELYDGPEAGYPFSGTFMQLPERAIGRRYPGRSAAVGSRSMLTHVCAGAEIAVECFARSLYNQGVLAAVRL